MPNILKKIEAAYPAALKGENVDILQRLTKNLIKFYKAIPEEDREEFDVKISKIFNTQNDQGKTAVMIDVEHGKGKIEENVYLFALESENLDILQNLINGLVKAYKETTDGQKIYGIDSLKIFNLKNSKKETAVMIAAKHGRADLLEKWYDIPDQLTDGIFDKEGREGVYEQRISSYVTQDNEGRNALMLAIKSNNSECFLFLLSPETAITINQKDKAGKTALMHAIESENINLIKKFISVTKKVLGGVNEYYPEHKVKLEICADTLKCIQNIKNKSIESLIIKFITESKEHISMLCKIPLSSLKRKNPEQYGTAPKKRREGGRTTAEIISNMTNVLKQKKTIDIDWLIKAESFINNTSRKDPKGELCEKLKQFEEERQKAGQFLLKELLHEADSSSLTSDQEKKIIDNIKKLVKEARIEFPKDLVQAIQMPDEDMRDEVFKIIESAKEKNGPNSQLHSTNGLASNASPQR